VIQVAGGAEAERDGDGVGGRGLTGRGADTGSLTPWLEGVWTGFGVLHCDV
jgi:hypothetical protein